MRVPMACKNNRRLGTQESLILTELTLFVTGVAVAGSRYVTLTTHAPHPAWPHMILVPFRWRWSRRKRARLVVVETDVVSTDIG